MDRPTENNVLMCWRNFKIVRCSSISHDCYQCYREAGNKEVIVSEKDYADVFEQLCYALVKQEAIFVYGELPDNKDPCLAVSSIKAEFRPGNTVKLKSGGPIMTLIQRVSMGIWQCAWFNDKGYSQADLPEVALSTSWSD
jgi:uncharacterized protein YodC (DUF2158 family)